MLRQPSSAFHNHRCSRCRGSRRARHAIIRQAWNRRWTGYRTARGRCRKSRSGCRGSSAKCNIARARACQWPYRWRQQRSLGGVLVVTAALGFCGANSGKSKALPLPVAVPGCQAVGVTAEVCFAVAKFAAKVALACAVGSAVGATNAEAVLASEATCSNLGLAGVVFAFVFSCAIKSLGFVFAVKREITLSSVLRMSTRGNCASSLA